jgi:hypothetical protein
VKQCVKPLKGKLMGRSVSYGEHFNSNLLKVSFDQCQSGHVVLRGKGGGTMLAGASGCVKVAGQNCD